MIEQVQLSLGYKNRRIGDFYRSPKLSSILCPPAGPCAGPAHRSTLSSSLGAALTRAPGTSHPHTSRPQNGRAAGAVFKTRMEDSEASASLTPTPRLSTRMDVELDTPARRDGVIQPRTGPECMLTRSRALAARLAGGGDDAKGAGCSGRAPSPAVAAVAGGALQAHQVRLFFLAGGWRAGPGVRVWGG